MKVQKRQVGKATPLKRAGGKAYLGDVSIRSRSGWRREWDSNPRYGFP